MAAIGTGANAPQCEEDGVCRDLCGGSCHCRASGQVGCLLVGHYGAAGTGADTAGLEHALPRLAIELVLHHRVAARRYQLQRHNGGNRISVCMQDLM